MSDNAPFGISEDSVSSVIRTKNKVIIGLALAFVAVAIYLIFR